MSNELDASVEDFFSQYDTPEETYDHSDSSSERTEVPEEPEPTKPADEVEDDKTDTPDDKQTPFHEHPRWQEKLAENKALKESNAKRDKEYQELMDRLDAVENKPLSDEDIENMTPREAMEYARKQTEREFNKKSELSTKEKDDANRYIDDTLAELKDEGNEFEENKLLKIADEYTAGDLKKAMDLYHKLEEATDNGATKAEKDAAKRKAAESNSGNRASNSKVTGYVKGTGWDSLSLK